MIKLCGVCMATGRLKRQKCYYCAGNGYVTYTPPKLFDVYEYTTPFGDLPEAVQQSRSMRPFIPYLKKVKTIRVNIDDYQEVAARIGVCDADVALDVIDDAELVHSVALFKEPAYILLPKGTKLAALK